MKIFKSIILTKLIFFLLILFQKSVVLKIMKKLKIKTSLKDIVEDNKLVETKFISEVIIKGESHLVEVEKFINK